MFAREGMSQAWALIVSALPKYTFSAETNAKILKISASCGCTERPPLKLLPTSDEQRQIGYTPWTIHFVLSSAKKKEKEKSSIFNPPSEKICLVCIHGLVKVQINFVRLLT